MCDKKLRYCLETARRESWTEMIFKYPSMSSKVAGRTGARIITGLAELALSEHFIGLIIYIAVVRFIFDALHGIHWSIREKPRRLADAVYR